MIPAEFDYVRAGSVDEAVQALVSGGEDAKVLAGGQSLMPLLRTRLAAPSVLVDCSTIADMRGVTDAGGALVIGAATTHHEVLHDDLVRAHAPLVAAATSTVADPAIRHRGTFGGSLAHADPAGDLPAVAVALGFEMEVAGPGGRRTVAASDFFLDFFTSALAPDEVLVSVRVPKLGDGWGFDYQKFHRTAQAWAIVGVATAVRRSNGSIAEARVGLTNMGATPIRASATEAALAGVDATPDAVAAAAAHAAEGTHPTSDIHAQAGYREHLARVLTKRSVVRAAGLA
jgi:aerobic carbon-monoxide dehydrogenase medium subunit